LERVGQYGFDWAGCAVEHWIDLLLSAKYSDFTNVLLRRVAKTRASYGYICSTSR
jgi:hypothetical protein